MSDENVRIESEIEVQSYIQDLKYALKNGAVLSFQVDRKVEEERDLCFPKKMSFHYAITQFRPEMFPYRK